MFRQRTRATRRLLAERRHRGADDENVGHRSQGVFPSDGSPLSDLTQTFDPNQIFAGPGTCLPESGLSHCPFLARWGHGALLISGSVAHDGARLASQALTIDAKRLGGSPSAPISVLIDVLKTAE
jgi:hypothetical protein